MYNDSKNKFLNQGNFLSLTNITNKHVPGHHILATEKRESGKNKNNIIKYKINYKNGRDTQQCTGLTSGSVLRDPSLLVGY